MKNTRLQQDRSRTFGMTPETQACLNCKYFKLHYVADSTTGYVYATPTYCGHCVYPRLKYRRVDDVCANFEREEL